MFNGVETYKEFLDVTKKFKIDDNTLITFEDAFRIHPFQTINWFNKKEINKNIFSEVCSDVEKFFYSNKKNEKLSDLLTVCIHVHLHKAGGGRSSSPRYAFSLEYYENIMMQLEYIYGKDKLNFRLYAEESNSEIMIDRFAYKKNVTYVIGKNRGPCEFEYIHTIFKEMVDSDILVCSNSSFSVVATYFRVKNKNKITIYHPHSHLNNLYEFSNCISTDINGCLEKNKINFPVARKVILNQFKKIKPIYKHAQIAINIPNSGTNVILNLASNRKLFKTSVINSKNKNRAISNKTKYLKDYTILPEQFTFAFVRNPWCRLVSIYNELHLKNEMFSQFLYRIDTDSTLASCKSILPQYKWICDENDNILVDFIGKFENLQQDFNIICDKIGIPQQQLPHRNKTKHKHYTEYYDEETKQIVAELYAKDIEYFNYEFE
jgi:hypothetical protein